VKSLLLRKEEKEKKAKFSEMQAKLKAEDKERNKKIGEDQRKCDKERA